jgi:hypothetical protein
MFRQTTTRASKRSAKIWRARPHDLVTLVSRLLFAQAGASAAVSLSYGRRNVASVLLAVLVAAVLCGLAWFVRSGAHTAWLMTIAFESAFVATGLFRYAYARYLGGTLLGIIALGTLLHPAVARMFAGARRVPEHTAAGLTEAAGELEAVS